MISEELENTLKNIEKHLETLVRLQVESVSQQVLDNETEKKAYDLTGVMKRNEICKKLHISPNKLTELRNRWLEVGLLIKDGKNFRKVLE